MQHVLQHFNVNSMYIQYTFNIQGDSKRLLKVHESITSTFYGVWDLKFCTEQLQNYTIWYYRWDGPMSNQSIFKLIIIFLVNFKKKPKFGTKFWQKLIILFENFEIKTFLTDARFKLPMGSSSHIINIGATKKGTRGGPGPPQ